MHRAALPCLALAVVACSARESPPVSEPVATGFVAKTLVVNGVEHRYQVYLPGDYAHERTWPAWPLIVFLHGMGECGTDGVRHLDVGLGPALRAEPDRWPFVVVFPQKPDRDSQWSEHEAMVMAMLAATEREYRIDPMRRLLTGLSQGGAGTWALGAKHADVWAAIAPICGYGNPGDVAAKLERMPIWAFHGADDSVVPVAQSKALCAAVDAARGHAVLTVYEDTAHDSWDKAYRESNLAEWLRTFPFDPPLATALAEPGELWWFWLTIGMTERAGADTWARVSLGSPERGEDWVLQQQRGAPDAVGQPVVRSVGAGAAVLCVSECVRLLVRAGVADARPPFVTEGDSFEIDYSFGIGGRSISFWPKRWSVGDPAAPLDAMRRAAELMRNVR